MSKTWELLVAGLVGFVFCTALGVLGVHAAKASIRDDCDKVNATVLDGKAYQCWRADLEVEAAPDWEAAPRREFR